MRQKFARRVGIVAPALWLAFGCDDRESPQALIEDVIEAAGVGALPPNAVERVEASGERFEPGEGYSLTQPLHMSRFTTRRSARVEGPQLRQTLAIDALAVLPQRLEFTETVDDSAGFVDGTDNIFGSDAPQSPIFSGRIGGQLRHAELTSPLRLAQLVRALAPSGRVGEAAPQLYEGRPHRVLTLLDDGGGATSLFIDPETRRIAKVETIEDHPPNGDTHVAVRFRDYRAVGAAWVPFEISIDIEGVEVHREQRQSAVIAEAASDTFGVPDALRVPFDGEEATRARRSSQWYAGFFHGGFSFFYFDQSDSEVEDVELAPGVHLLRGPSHHNLLVEQNDSLLVVDAPMYDARTLAVLEHIERQPYGRKPLRHVVATHFHQDHCGGIRAFAAEGDVTVFAGTPSEAYFREVFERPHTLVEDRFAQAPREVAVRGVADSQRIEDAERPVELYRIANSHSDDMLIVYLPNQRLLFTADLYGPNPYTVGQRLPGDYETWARELYDAVMQRGLAVDVVVGAHGEGTGTLEDVRIGGGR